MQTQRVSIKFGGASGQGINTTGVLLVRALKKHGLRIFGYREYPSRIKGGIASYQVDISNKKINSSSRYCNILLVFTQASLNEYLKDVKENGIIVYDQKDINLTDEQRNKLAVPGEDKYLGKGVSYCATCDAMFYKNKVVGVVGGSNAAIMAATLLADIAKQVYIIYRGIALRGEPAWIDDVKSKKNVEIILTTVVTAIEGDGAVERVKLSKEFNGSYYLNIDGLFIEIGSEPNADLPNKLGVALDEENYIIVKDDQSTSIEGVWAAGDATTNSNKLQQVATAVGEGAVAANSVYSYLKNASNR